jgi:hypothetical protein
MTRLGVFVAFLAQNLLLGDTAMPGRRDKNNPHGFILCLANFEVST